MKYMLKSKWTAFWEHLAPKSYDVRKSKLLIHVIVQKKDRVNFYCKNLQKSFNILYL